MIPILSDRYGSHRCRAKNVLLFALMILVILVSGQEEYSQADLEAMTEVELEDICVKRGFQLVNDNSDELTKQDYIEAAQRCISIEQEMNELLTQFPELADELEEEIKRMEKENAGKQAHVDDLKNDLSNDGSHVNRSDPGTAFTRPAKGRGSENDGHIIDEVENDELVVPDEVPLDESPEDFLPADDAVTSDNTEPDEDIEDLDTTTTVEPIGSQETLKKEDLTLTHIAIESLRVLVKNAQDDVKRIINLAIPVLQPLLNVGDVAWRQIQTLFVRAREVYEAYQATNTPSSEVTETPETCDDSVYS